MIPVAKAEQVLGFDFDETSIQLDELLNISVTVTIACKDGGAKTLTMNGVTLMTGKTADRTAEYVVASLASMHKSGSRRYLQCTPMQLLTRSTKRHASTRLIAWSVVLLLSPHAQPQARSRCLH